MKLTTEQAFVHLIEQRAIHVELELSSSTVRGWRKRIRDNENDPTKWGISKNLMESLLEKAGYLVIQEKIWETPSTYPSYYAPEIKKIIR